MPPKQRGARSTAEQMEIMIQYIQGNRIMITGKTHPNNTKEVEEHWQKLSEMLNSARGARKTVEEWRRFFTEWKSKTRAKARDSKIDSTATGGGPYKDKKLSDLEERLMSLIGWVSVSGAADLPAEIEPNENETIELDNLNVVEDVIIENLVDDEENLVIPIPETISVSTQPANQILPTPASTSVPLKSTVLGMKKNLKLSRKKPARSTTTALEKSAQIYAESNIRLTAAVEAFAEGLTKLANAIEKYAGAMEKIALKKGEQD